MSATLCQICGQSEPCFNASGHGDDTAPLRTFVDGFEVHLEGMADTDSTDDVFVGWYLADWDQRVTEFSGERIDWVRADGSVVGGVWCDGTVAA